MNPRYLTFLKGFGAAEVVMFCAFVFMHWQVNPALWGEGVRISFIILGGGFSLATGLILALAYDEGHELLKGRADELRAANVLLLAENARLRAEVKELKPREMDWR
jgi:hypothetical protein